MQDQNHRDPYGLTGLHIGASSGFHDRRDRQRRYPHAYGGDPIIPGSSSKGPDAHFAGAQRARIVHSERLCEIRLWCCACSARRACGGENRSARRRLQFSDAFLSNKEKLLKIGGTTEAKTENFITRSTSVANRGRPARSARRGFAFGIIPRRKRRRYRKTYRPFANACKLIQMDYLGGSGRSMGASD